MPSRKPPRYVPTLTEVVKAPPASAGADSGLGLTPEQLILKVMQRVDSQLERRLREAIAQAVLEQTRALGQRLRDEIESVVRETVAQAFADEAAAGSRTHD